MSSKTPAAKAAAPAKKGKSATRTVGPVSRSTSYRRQRLYQKLKNIKKAAPKAPAARPAVAEPKYYPAYDAPKPLPSNKKARPASFRASLVPGAVLILLAGKFQGKRVVLLKTLPSGLLLVTGPYKLNGVPLRRVNPSYVIATSTKVDISKIKLSDKLNDDHFKKPAQKKEKKGEDSMFSKSKATATPASAAQKAEQKQIDDQLLTVIKGVPLLKAYLRSTFTLTKGQTPHTMKF